MDVRKVVVHEVQRDGGEQGDDVVDRSVTALAKKTASPAPSLPPRRLNHARAHETAHWLCAFVCRRPF